MVLAFRLYGDFQWPPRSSVPREKPVSRKGTVEIHFVPKPDGSAAQRALLRWVPRSQQQNGSIPPLEEIPEEPGKLPHLFDLPPDEAANLLFREEQDKEEQIVAVWLDKSDAAPKPKNHTWLLFRGAFLFEQHRAIKDFAEPALDLQWPLVEQCEYRRGATVYSSLGICHRVKPLFYFNFHLPFPVRRTSHSGGPDLNPRAFPFSAVFDLAPRKDQYLLRIDTLVAGWKAGDALPDLKKPEPTCFPFEGETNPETNELGMFGFAEFGKTSGTEFAVFKIESEATHDYWPLNRQALVQDILWPYGFSLDYDFTAWLRPTNLGLADSSLRFVKQVEGGEGERGRKSALVYRASVSPNKDTVGPDLQSDANGLRIRLQQELGGRKVAGTQFGADGAPEPGDPVEGWLRIGDTLSADCELSWEIAPQDIWTDDRDADWSPTITVRLHWLETVAPGHVAPQAAVSADFQAGLLAQANFSFLTVRDALEPGEAGQPHSFLPELSAAKSTSVRFALYGSPLPARFTANGIEWGRPVPKVKGARPPWLRSPMRLSLAKPDDRHLIADADEFIKDPKKFPGPTLQLDLNGSTPTFFQTPETDLALTLAHDESWPPESADRAEDGPPFFASFALQALAKTPWRGRLASLQFGGSPDRPNVIQSGHLRIGGRGARLGLGDGGPILTYPDGRIAAEISLPLPAVRVEPIGVDVARTDRSGRPAPLLIPLDPTTGGPATGPNVLWLTATETLSPTQDRQLVATLSETSQETGTRSYVVLSSEPFSIFRFTHQPLHARGQEDTTYVAFYSGDDRIWQYRRVSDFYHYVLPPQAVGESADKPRRLEIHDLKPDVALAHPPQPFVLDLEDENHRGQSGLKRRAVEFRLTPSAELWIRPSDVERGYFMPESASHEIFRQAGAFGFGAALGYLRAEFLYGMPVGIDVSKERSISRGARVAEIEALTGRLTGPAQQTNAEIRVANRWNAIRAAVARRPERLEIWARDLDSAVDFTPARFSDGVQFALRYSALHRAPLVEQPESAAEHAAPPRIAGLEPASVPPALAAYPRHHPQGLSGGALWPVESLNLFRILLQNPYSNGGVIESIALTPNGGDATQKAEFLGGKVTIISETREGSLQRQQVEVLGRICAFWHRAKHVVVYERTVNPSAQFAPKKEEDLERTRSRRPILRKVREYIELLQPERSYPDFQTATRRSNGCLERVRFNSKTINVDSAWSSEVGDYGWQIPLWNRLAARERPQVYGMPDTAFVSTAEGDGDKPVVAQECLDPDYLFFFADFSPETTSDTDTWASRLNLDYPNMPAASAIARHADKNSSKSPGESDHGHENRRRAVGRILPGLRRFTWRLAPAAQKVAINAGRAAKPVYAGLDSITFMRATHATDEHKELPNEHPLTKALDKSASGNDNATLANRPYWDSTGQNAAFPEGTEFSKNIQAVLDALNDKNKDKDVLNAARKALGAHWDANFKDKLKKLIPSDFDQSHFENFQSALTGGPAFCEKLKSDAVGMVQRKEMLVRSALQDWVGDADAFLNELEKDFQKGITKDQAVDRLVKLATAYVRPLFDEASKDIGKVEEGVEKARATLIDVENEIDAVVERARARIQQFVRGYDDTKPWSQERRRAFRAGLEACVSNVGDDIAAAVEEARQRLAVELNEVSQAIGGHIARALKQAASQQADALKGISKVERFVHPLVARIDAKLENLLHNAKGEKLDDLIAKVEAAYMDGKITKDLRDKATAALTALKAACEDAKKNIDAARDQAKAFDASVEQAATDMVGAINALVGVLTDIGKSLAQQMQDLLAVAGQLAGHVDELKSAFETIVGDLNTEIAAIIAWPDQWLNGIGSQIDAMVVPAAQSLDALLVDLKAKLQAIPAGVLPVIEDAKGALARARDALGPDQLLETLFQDQVVRPALERVLQPLPATIDAGAATQAVADIKARLLFFDEEVTALIRGLTANALTGVDEVSSVCREVFEGAAEVQKYFDALAKDVGQYFDDQLKAARDALTDKLGDLTQDLKDFPADAENLIEAVQSVDRTVRGLQNNLSRAHESARMYADRVFDQFSKLDEGGILAAPSNILKLYSAVTSAPEIAALKADIDRIRSGFDELSDVIETTKANALFNRLGDELKAIGLSVPFDKIGERLQPNLEDCEIAKVFRNFGAKLEDMLKGYKVPSGVADAVRITHDFDKAQARAWVEIDIDAPMPGRRSLFSVGVFKADFVDMRLGGKVRLEASKDDEKVTETGLGRIDAVIDLVVGGQSMVRFEKFALNFTREKGLEVEFDPKNIRLNPQFKFIQDFLSTLFPGDVGGLQIIKQNGIPVGVQHDFAIPPLALNFGTSGVSNISIENHFKLLAFPDFMLANRFNLSTVERPFIFSIFIIGGTGYIQIDAEYRPFDRELTVIVEAGAGGSASLAFAFGPFSGQVFITLSGTLAYRKMIGKPGGGLSISVVLVIAGHVNVAGIVTVGIVLMLRMTYRDDGQIDGNGSLTVTIRISRFFELTARANAKYKLRGGKSETTVSGEVSGKVNDPKLEEKVKALQKAADKLEKARN